MAEGFGAFGKIPGVGDFLRINVSAGFVQAWDTWLQEGMLEVKGLLGSAWDEAFLSAPIWRFSLPAGKVGERAYSGILMASVDRVGRQYPLTLALPHDGSNVPLTHFANRVVFERLEHIALAALDDGFTKDALTEAIGAVNWITPQHVAVHGDSYIGAHPPAQIIAADHVSASHGQTALWSAAMEGHHRLMLTSGLPKGREMVGLFDLDAPVWHAQDEAAFL